MAIENNHRENEKPKAAASAVKVISKSMAVPSKKPEKSSCLLATFDLPYITLYYNQKLLLYKLTDKEGQLQEYRDTVERMKVGLGAALGYFYPLAGRIGKDEDGVVIVECSGESLVGAEVTEAVAEDVTVEEVAEGEASELLQELVPYTGVMNLEGLHRPLLAVQFTKLKDGLALGCAFNHAILDGNSTWHFMTSWSELCRTPTSSIEPTVSLPPSHDRAQARATRIKLNLPTSPQAHELGNPNGPPKPFHAKIFSFSESSLQKLKSVVNSNLPPNSKPLSTFQSLGVHVWRAVCRARALKPDDFTVFAIFIDCRSRLDPPLPDSYFGNVIQAIFAVTTAAFLLASPPENGAGLLQKVIDAHDAKAITARLEEYEAKPKMFYYTDAGINCVAVGSSPRFRVYDVDFGFGRPERVRSGSNNKFDGMVYLYPGRDGGKSIDMEITLEGEAMKNLEKDEEFLMVAA